MIKKKKIFFSIGTMSGTSFDGVDAALIKTDGENYFKFIDSAFLSYSKKEKRLYKYNAPGYA